MLEDAVSSLLTTLPEVSLKLVKALEVTRKLCEVWEVHKGLRRWCTLKDRRFARLTGHSLEAAPSDHLKRHSGHLEALAANMKSILEDFITAIPVEPCLFSDLCNEMIGKLVSNGCQRAKYLLSALNSKNSFMMIHLSIILKSKHGFAELFSLWLFSFLNDFKLHLQAKRLMALNIHAKN